MSHASSITRLTLLPTAPRDGGAGAPRIRRYRLASVRPAGAQGQAGRLAHLKHGDD